MQKILNQICLPANNNRCPVIELRSIASEIEQPDRKELGRVIEMRSILNERDEGPELPPAA